DRLGRWADEGEPRLRARGGEAPVLREKPIPRVNRVGAGVARRTEDRGHVEVALPRGRAAHRDRFVGAACVERLAVGLRVHGDGLHAERPTGAEDPEGNFPTVGDEDLPEHYAAGAADTTSASTTRQPSSRRRHCCCTTTAPPGPKSRTLTSR